MKYNKYQLLNSNNIYRIVMLSIYTIFLIVYISKAFIIRSYKEYYYDAERKMFASDNSNLLITYKDYMMLKYHGYCFSLVHVVILFCISILFFGYLQSHRDVTLTDTFGKVNVISALIFILLIIIFV